MAITSNSGTDTASTTTTGIDAPAGTTAETISQPEETKSATSRTTNKKENDVATSKSNIQKRKIAKYNGSTIHTRVLDKKSVNKSLKTSLDRDLVWDRDNNWEVDVTDVPAEVLNYLDNVDDDFSVSERDVDMSDIEDA